MRRPRPSAKSVKTNITESILRLAVVLDEQPGQECVYLGLFEAILLQPLEYVKGPACKITQQVVFELSCEATKIELHFLLETCFESMCRVW